MSWLITGSEKTPVDPQFTSVSLLLHGNGSSIVDSSRFANAITNVNSVTQSTVQVKFGDKSLLFNGSSNYLNLGSKPIFDLAAGDFTVESWIRPSTVSGFRTICGTWTNQQFALSLNGASVYFSWFPASAGSSLVGGGTVVADTWQHVAVTRQGTSFRAFLDGQLLQTATNTAIVPTLTANLFIGAYPDSGGNAAGFFNGYIDDLRITKGVARYTANFTPPTAPFPDI
jgi:hypothetical protein